MLGTRVLLCKMSESYRLTWRCLASPLVYPRWWSVKCLTFCPLTNGSSAAKVWYIELIFSRALTAEGTRWRTRLFITVALLLLISPIRLHRLPDPAWWRGAELRLPLIRFLISEIEKFPTVRQIAASLQRAKDHLSRRSLSYKLFPSRPGVPSLSSPFVWMKTKSY